MENTNFIQATIELFGVVITLVVSMIFVIITGNRNKSEKTLFHVLLGTGFTLLVDAGWYIFDGNPTRIGYYVNWVCNFAIFIINPILVMLVIRFVCSIIWEKDKEPQKVLVVLANFMAILALSIQISNLFYKWVYYIDEFNVYHRMFGWYLYTVINSLALILCIILVVVNRNTIPKGRRRAIYFFWMAPFIGIALQALNTGYSYIQLGTAVGCLAIVGDYLVEWFRRENKYSGISEDSKKMWLFESVFFVLILFISAAIFSCGVSVNSVSNENSEKESTALAYMVSETVERSISEPINVSRTMAQSEIIIDALSLENIENTDSEEKMLAFMKRIKDEYGYSMIFVASEKTGAYYTYEGFSRIMDVSQGANDAWYSEFKDRNRVYELNIDKDKDNNMNLSVFVNMTVKDVNGEFLGVCGVGMSIESLMDILAEYEKSYNMDISLTDLKGLIEINTDRNKIEKEYCDLSSIDENRYDEISYERSKSKAVLIKRMGDFDWYLYIVDNNPNKLNVFVIIRPSIIIYILGVLCMFGFSLIFSLHERNRSKLLQENKQQTEVAKAESEAKGKFLANMSHEIRTPINAVLGMDTMILRESHEPQIKEYAMNIQNAGSTLLSLINDILDISKIESGKMEIVPVEYDFATLINDVMNMINMKAESKGLELRLVIDKDLPAGLYGDDVRIRQILVNLMSNAVKYTKEGSVTLLVNGTKSGDSVKLDVCVKDTGIGIKEEDLDKLYEEFVRIEEKRNKDIEGSGLGMSITVHLLSLMNSKLEVASVYGEGSVFSFEIEQKVINPDPVGDINQRMHQKAENYKYSATFTAPNASILLVDDNDINRMVFMNLLKETKLSIDEASNGRAALQLVYDKPYDIIFLDHMMPDMDGIEVMHKIKESEDHPNIKTPVIALTANALSGVKEMYLAAGFNDYLSKPIIPDRLEKMIVSLLPSDKVEAAEIGDISNKSDDVEIPMTEGIDWNYAKLHLSSNTALMTTIRSFAESIESEAEILEGLYNELIANPNDENIFDSYRIRVHAMKSTATLLGCVPIAGMAATLEYAARGGNVDRIRDITPHFLACWREYRDKLSFAMISNDEKKDIDDYALIVDYINQLKESIQVFDVHGADSALEELKKYNYNPDIEKVINRISVAVNNLDSDEVSKLCDDLLAEIEV